MSHISNWLTVHMRPTDAHAPVFEVVSGATGQWHYRQRRGGRIANSSETYFSKGNAKRAAYAQAAQVPGSRVRVLHAHDAGFDEV